jgi:hypothetical protein
MRSAGTAERASRVTEPDSARAVSDGTPNQKLTPAFAMSSSDSSDPPK